MKKPKAAPPLPPDKAPKEDVPTTDRMVQAAFKLDDPDLIARRQEEIRASAQKHAREDALFRRGTTPGETGSTGTKDKPIGPHTLVSKTDPQGGSSKRSASRDALDGLYKGICDKQSDVKREEGCNLDKDVTPGTEEDK